jgi:hypothetical protein
MLRTPLWSGSKATEGEWFPSPIEYSIYQNIQFTIKTNMATFPTLKMIFTEDLMMVSTHQNIHFTMKTNMATFPALTMIFTDDLMMAHWVT